jgi:hypothetical protein
MCPPSIGWIAALSIGVTKLQAGPLVLELHASPSASLFHVVDQLSDWHEFCHKQYKRLPGVDGPEDQALLRRHAAIRKARGGYGVLDQTFYTDDDWPAALARAAKEGRLTPAEVDTERKVLEHFAPKLKAFIDEGGHRVEAAIKTLVGRREEIEKLARRMSRFAGGSSVAVVAYLIPSPGQSGGGGANGGIMTVEVGEDADPHFVLLHESWHAFMQTQDASVRKAAAEIPGLDRTTLSEGLAYAFQPGLVHREGDSLVRAVQADFASHQSFRDSYTRFRRFGLALLPLLEQALADERQTLITFLPRACDVFRAVESLSDASDGAPKPLLGIFVFGSSRKSVIDRATKLKVNVWGRSHDEAAYAQTLAQAHANDIIVLLVTPDDRGAGPPSGYRDLLPVPWEAVQSALTSGKTLEAKGSARGYRVLLLAAPSSEALATLVERSAELALLIPR